MMLIEMEILHMCESLIGNWTSSCKCSVM